MELTRDYLTWTAEACRNINGAQVESIIGLLMAARKSGNRIFIVGNGGSAATASHFCEDLGKCTLLGLHDTKRFKVISLTDNLPYVTAWANDNGYDQVFEQQLRNLGEEGDLVIGISASGNSPNVVNAMEYARSAGMGTAGMTGFNGGAVRELSDCSLHTEIPMDPGNSWQVRSSTANYGMIENMHMIAVHMIIATIVQRLHH